MNIKKRVLFIAQAAGGVERYLRMLFVHMDKNKYEIVFVCSFSYDKNAYKSLVDRIIQIDMRRKIGLHDVYSCMEFRSIIKKTEPDIIYAHSSKAGFIARVSNVGLDAKVLYNPHGWAFNMKISKAFTNFYKIIERLTSGLCDKIICISNFERQSAVKKKICAENKIQVIYNGIEVDNEIETNLNNVTRQKLGISADAFVIGMVGRLSKQKAPDNFVRVAIKVGKLIPNAYFLLVGDGEELEKINAIIKDNHFENFVSITGWIDNSMDYIKLFDVAMLLSRWEGFGLVLAEYMLARKPIIATRVDAIPEIIVDRYNGLLVDSEDIDAAVNSIIELYNKPMFANELAENGWRIVKEKYNIRRVAFEHDNIFESVLTKHD